MIDWCLIGAEYINLIYITWICKMTPILFSSRCDVCKWKQKPQTRYIYHFLYCMNYALRGCKINRASQWGLSHATVLLIACSCCPTLKSIIAKRTCYRPDITKRYVKTKKDNRHYKISPSFLSDYCNNCDQMYTQTKRDISLIVKYHC